MHIEYIISFFSCVSDAQSENFNVGVVHVFSKQKFSYERNFPWGFLSKSTHGFVLVKMNPTKYIFF